MRYVRNLVNVRIYQDNWLIGSLHALRKNTTGNSAGALREGKGGRCCTHTHFPPGCQRSSLWLTVSFNWLWSIYCCQFDKSMQANVAQVKPNRIGFSLNWNADEPRLQASGTSEASRQRCGACSCYLFQLAPDSGHEPEIIKQKTLNLRRLER